MSELKSPKSFRTKKKKFGLFGLGGKSAPLDDLENENASERNEDEDSDEGRGFVPGSQYNSRKPASLSNLSAVDDDGGGGGGGDRGRERGRGRDGGGGDDGGRDRSRSRSVSVTRALRRIVGGGKKKDKEKEKGIGDDGAAVKKTKKKKEKAKKTKKGGKKEDDGEEEFLSRGSESLDLSDSDNEDARAPSDGENSLKFEGEVPKKVKKKKKEGAAKKKKRRPREGRPGYDGENSAGSLDMSLDGSVKRKTSGRGRRHRTKDGEGENLEEEAGQDSMGSLDEDFDDDHSTGTGKLQRTPTKKKSSRAALIDEMFDEGSVELASGNGDGGGIADDGSVKSGKSAKSARSARSALSGRNSPSKKKRSKKAADTLPLRVVEGGSDDESSPAYYSAEKRKSFSVDIQDLRKEVSKRRLRSSDPDEKMTQTGNSFDQRDGGIVRLSNKEESDGEDYERFDDDLTPPRPYDDENGGRGVLDDSSIGLPKDPPSSGYYDDDRSGGGADFDHSNRSETDDWSIPGDRKRDPEGSADFKVTPRKELDDFESFRTSWNQSARAEREEDATVASMAETVDDLKDKLDIQRKETETAQAQLADALDMVSQLTEDLNRAATTGEELIDVQRELNEMVEDRAALQEALDRLEDEMAVKDRRIENLEVAVESQLDKVEFLEEKLEQTEDEMFNLEDEVRRLEDEQQIKVLDDYDKRLQMRGSLKIERQERKSLFRADSQKLLKGHSSGSRTRNGASKSKKGDRGVIMENGDSDNEKSTNLEEVDESKDGTTIEADNLDTDTNGAGSSSLPDQLKGGRGTEIDFDKRVDSLGAWEKELEDREKQLEADRELDEMKERRLDDWERELEQREVLLTQRSFTDDQSGVDDDASHRDLLRRERELAEDRKTLQAEKRRVIASSLQLKQSRQSLSNVDEHVEELEHENKSMQRNHTGELFQTRLQLKKKDDEIFFLKDEMDKLRTEMEKISMGGERRGTGVTEKQEEDQNGANRQLRDLDDRNRLLQSQLKEEKTKSRKVEELENRVATLELELRVMEKEKEQLELENKKLHMHEEKDRKEHEKKKLKEETMQLLQQEMTDQLAELDDENQNLTKKLSNKQREFEDMLEEKDEIIADLKDSLEELKKNLESSDSGAYVTTLLKDLNDLKKKKRGVDKLERDLSRATAELEERDLLISKSKKEIAQLKEDLDLVLTDTDEAREKADRADGLEHDLLETEQELIKMKKEMAQKDVEGQRIKESFTELMKAEARHSEELELELRKYKDSEKDGQIDGSTKSKKDGTDDYASKLKKELKSLKDEHKALKKQLKAEQQKASQDLKKKDESIKFFQDEMVRLKKDAEKKFKSQKRPSDNRDKERRIVDLEDEVDHWKAVNISLEDEVELWKSEAREWKSKAEGKYLFQDDDDDDQSIASMSMSITSARHNEDPLQVSQHSISSLASKDYLFYGSSDKTESSQNAAAIDDSASQRAARSVASLWSTLVAPKGPPQPKGNSAIPSYFNG